ncbi:MAG: redoxin domain-containing protein [Flavobacteriaceae bacterium]|nr:redoxin domain-containing protein [Flavobacteriaceae bacterium]
MALQPGDKAPSFTLFNSEKEEISLANYAGKNLLILFFPQAFTGTCTKELCDMRDNIVNYQNMGCDVVAISVDSLFTLAKYKEVNAFPFPLLSDFNKETSRAYGSIFEEWINNMKGVSKRSAFVVDGEGTLRYAEVLEKAGDLPNFEAINATIATLN